MTVLSDSDLPVAVVGTAGHIDHGKSALVHALTGTDPDRLPEEKKRGITIELGYAPLKLPSGRTVSMVDVPGHERFIKTMASGASVIDMAILVVDAGDGVKPQSVEHLGILRALGVERGLVALSKCDVVDPELVELAAEEVTELVEGTFLQGAPIIKTSAVSGQGLDELRSTLDEMTVDFRSAVARQPLRMPIDRAFVMSGFGTVVTGTLLGGSLTESESVLVQPAGIEARIRGVQVHGAETGIVHAPSRAALNLAGVDAGESLRGQWVTRSGDFEPSLNVLAMVRLMQWVRKPIKLPASMSINLGSSVVNCQVHGLMDGPRQAPLTGGPRHLIRIEAEQSLVARAGDRIILRVGGGLGGGFSTAAGGQIIDPLWGSGRLSQGLAEQVVSIDDDDPGSWIAFALRGAGAVGLDIGNLAQRVPLPPSATSRSLETILRDRKAIKTSKTRAVDAKVYERALKRGQETLTAFHAAHPEKVGLNKDSLGDRAVGRNAKALADTILRKMIKAGRWKMEGDLVAHQDHEPRSDNEIADLALSVMGKLQANPASPPTMKALASELGTTGDKLARATDLLVADGRARLLGGEFLFSVVFLSSLSTRVRQFFSDHEKMMVTDLKAIAGVTRKHALPLARWLDDEGVTVRRGDFRILKG